MKNDVLREKSFAKKIRSKIPITICEEVETARIMTVTIVNISYVVLSKLITHGYLPIPMMSTSSSPYYTRFIIKDFNMPYIFEV